MRVEIEGENARSSEREDKEVCQKIRKKEDNERKIVRKNQ